MSGECEICGWHTLECICIELKIAKKAYRDIKNVITRWEKNKENNILMFWPGYISVNSKIFQEHELN